MSRRRAAIVVFIAALALALPMGVIASHQFSDVPTSHPFHNDIAAIANAGVTGACAAGKYCPSSFVTRGQMAAFMNRLGALGPTKPPIVNAAELDGMDSSEFMQHADMAVQHGGPWISNANFTITVEQFSDLVLLNSAGAGLQVAQLTLDAPTVIGGQAYGLESVTVCTNASTQNAIITETRVVAMQPAAASLIFDPTDRGDATTCYTITDATPTVVASNLNLILSMNFSGAGNYSIASVSSVWTPDVVEVLSLDEPPLDAATTAPTD